MARIYSFLKV